MQKIVNLYLALLNNIKKLQPLIMLAARLWIAHIFLISGWLKITDFSNTITLFTYEFPVPFLPPLIAAIFGTFFELTCSTLLILGLATRLAAIPLIVMTAVINFTYLQATEHYHWATILGLILCYGGDKLSLDYLIAKRYAVIKNSY